MGHYSRSGPGYAYRYFPSPEELEQQAREARLREAEEKAYREEKARLRAKQEADDEAEKAKKA